MRRVPDDVRAAILSDVKAEAGSCRAIAADHGVSPDTVRRIAADARLVKPFARAQTKNATAAAVADNAARRAAIAARLLDITDAALTQAIAELAGATARDAATVVGIALDKHMRLDQHDRADDQHTDVDAWLEAMTGGGA